MDGCEDDRQYDSNDNTPISIFRVDDEDRLIFPELEDTVEVWLWEDDQGFVGTRTFETDDEIPSWDDVDEEESDDQDPTEPSECDLVTTDHVHFYERGMSKGVVLTIDEDAEESMTSQLKHFMDKNRFWPNVWFLSEHGNYHLMCL